MVSDAVYLIDTILHFLGDGTYLKTAKTLPADTHLFTVPTLTPTYRTGIASYTAYLLLQTVFPSLPPPNE